MDLPELVLQPIGVIHTPFRERVSAPRQPRAATGVQGTIELLPGRHFEDALRDLEGWEYIWVLFWFHLNHSWRPTVLPPRSTQRRGLFSTRTPHRPNPLGLSVLRLERVEGLLLHVKDVDLLDGTPVLDIKPYVPWADAIPTARTGWLESPTDEAATETTGARPHDPQPGWEVGFAVQALEQLEFLRTHGVELEESVRQVLTLGPQPHAYRRIKLAPDGSHGVLALKEWRVHFRAESSVRGIEVEAIASGYRPSQLADDTPALAPHRALQARWGSP